MATQATAKPFSTFLQLAHLWLNTLCWLASSREVQILTVEQGTLHLSQQIQVKSRVRRAGGEHSLVTWSWSTVWDVWGCPALSYLWKITSAVLPIVLTRKFLRIAWFWLPPPTANTTMTPTQAQKPNSAVLFHYCSGLPAQTALDVQLCSD